MQIREVGIEELKSIVNIEKSTFYKLAYNKKELEAMLKNPNSFTFLCFDDEAMGYINVEYVSGDWANIDSVGVVPKHKKKGVGSLLLKEAEERINQLEVKVCTLEVRIHNRKAIRFYEKYGYRIEKTIKDFYTRKYRGSKDAYLMVKYF